MGGTIRLILLLVVALACSNGSVIELRQHDFDTGSFLIDKPGEYRLMEDIVFNPNSMAYRGVSFYDAGRPLPYQSTYAGGPYHPASFGLGFFCAIAVYGPDVTLDLNGFELSQSPEHALQQRFFALIELGNMPFIPKQGPHDFAGGKSFLHASNVTIKNGRLGLSAHHGIHGNNPENVLITDLVLEDYEVAAISINGAINLQVVDVHAKGARRDVPVVGTWSAGLFSRPYLEYLQETNYAGTIRIQGEDMTLQDVRGALQDSIERVYEDVILSKQGGRGGQIDPTSHRQDYDTFHNRHGVVDGNAFGLVFHGNGLAVNDFPVIPDDPALMIRVKNVVVEEVLAHVMEVASLTSSTGRAVTDAVGAVFHVFTAHPEHKVYTTISSSTNMDEARYLGNVVANVQAFIGKAALAGAFEGSRLDTSRSGFDERILQWIEAEEGTPESFLQNLLNDQPPVCNCDTMMHVNKGTVGIRLEGVSRAHMKNVTIRGVRNGGAPGMDICPYNLTTSSNPNSLLPGYQGAVSRGMSVSGTTNVLLQNMTITEIEASCGSSIGIDVLQDSHDIRVEDTFVDLITASKDLPMSAYHGPNFLPQTIGIKAADTSRRITTLEISTGNHLVNAENGEVHLIVNDSQMGADVTSWDESSLDSSSAPIILMAFPLLLIALF